MRVYCTATRDLVTLEPKPRLAIYVCGITPYASMHLGHVALLLTYDVLARRMRSLGSDVTLVRNITDIDDPLLPHAQKIGMPYWDLVTGEIAQLRRDARLLDAPAQSEPRASDHVDGMVDMIEELLANGRAYHRDGWIYYNVSADPAFGELSRLPREEMIELSRERGGDPDRQDKKDPLDFVLWQPARPGEPEYQTSLGTGRPGWHVGCSVMSRAELGDHIDVHGGGDDLIFPHHECEHAQNRSVTGGSRVDVWLHVAHMAYQGHKMSKSRGNYVLARDVLATHDPRALRLAVLNRYHHRYGFEWRDEHLDEGVRLLDRFLAARAVGAAGAGGAGGAGGGGPRRDDLAAEFLARVDDDLDFPGAVAVLDRWAGALLAGGGDPAAGDAFARAAAILGLDLDRPAGVLTLD